jgi:hypothetical protein
MGDFNGREYTQWPVSGRDFLFLLLFLYAGLFPSPPMLHSGGTLTLGEAAARAKLPVGRPEIIQSYILPGDPAMRMR